MTISLITRASVKGMVTTARAAGDAVVQLDETSWNIVADGDGESQANSICIMNFTIPASEGADIDLSGSLTDPNNNFVVFTSIKEILITADAVNVSDVVYGDASLNQFLGPMGSATDTIAIKPGGRLNFTDGYSAGGWPVVNSASDRIRLANNGDEETVTGTITIIGVS